MDRPHYHRQCQRLLIICLLALHMGHTRAETRIHFVHNDHLGTPQVITNTEQTMVWQATYHPFGNANINEDVDNNGEKLELNLRFPGQYHDPATGLYYNYYRDYAPQSGRYVQSDPIGLAGGISTYGYVNGNPLSLVDPTGEVGIAGAIIGGFIGGVSAFSGGLSTGSTLTEASIAAGVGSLAGAATGFFGGVGVNASALIGGGTNIVGQKIANHIDNDECNNADINWGSVIGSSIGGAWAATITRGSNPFSSAIIGWGPSTTSGAIGAELGQRGT